MKKHLAIALFFVLTLLQAFSKAITMLSFQINQDYIAKNLCEQKDNIKSCCKGKCYLAKQLSEEDNSEKNSSPTKLVLKFSHEDLMLFHQGVFASLYAADTQDLNDIKGMGTTTAYKYLPVVTITHPPIA